MSAFINIKVNPDILIWARKESGMSREDVVKNLNLKAPDLIEWETNGEGMPFDVLQSIAKIYKRQTAVFFLPEVPPRTQKIKDCRNLVKDRGHFSPDTLLAIRRTSRYLRFARELLNPSYWNAQYGWMKYFSDKQKDLILKTKLLRRILDAPLDEQMSQRNPEVAFRYWRSKIEEKLGIFVFQFSMPEEELDGFSYAFKELPYGIAINNKKVPVRKIFTLFHELAHILKHSPGVCQTNLDLDVEKDTGIEFECNNFAGNFLVPKEKVKIANSVKEIFELARLFNVSGEVYLRRLLSEKEIERSVFFELLDGVRERSRKFRRKKKKGYPSMIIKSRSTRGNRLFDIVVNAATKNKINFSVASDLLGLKVRNIHL